MLLSEFSGELLILIFEHIVYNNDFISFQNIATTCRWFYRISHTKILHPYKICGNCYQINDSITMKHIACLELLCQNQGNEYRKAYLEAAEKGSLDIIVWLDKKYQINFDKNAAIKLASENGHLEIVQYLVSLGANIHADNEFAVLRASANGHLEVVKYLVSLGAIL